ncbi:hypothetical protein ACOMHN_022338 [Nucella lapillus]
MKFIEKLGDVTNGSVQQRCFSLTLSKDPADSDGFEAGSTSLLDRQNKDRKSQFQSKYEGRHNGGVPCFTEERSMERAAKRVAEMKKKYEDDKQREVSFVCVEEPALYPYPSHMYPQVLSQEDLNHRLQVALSEGTANLSRTLMGMNVRTGYTHAAFRHEASLATFYNLQEIHPTINGNYLLAAHLAASSSSSPSLPHHYLSNSTTTPITTTTTTLPSENTTAITTPTNGYTPTNGEATFPGLVGHVTTTLRHLPPTATNNNAGDAGQDNSSQSDEDSDSGGSSSEVVAGGVKSQSAMLPLAARRSPYTLDLFHRLPATTTSTSTLATFTPRVALGGGGHGGGGHGVLGGSVSSSTPSSSLFHLPPSAPPRAQTVVSKQPVRYKTSQSQMQRILRRHSLQVAPPITTSSIQPISRDPPRHYENHVSSMATGAVTSQTPLAPERPQYERPRIGRGPLIRGLRHLGIRQGYMWE